MSESKRFYDVIFGIDYTIVARDEAHVLDLLREADFDFAETLASEGAPCITELSPERAAAMTIWDDNAETADGRVPLLEMPLGTMASSEFA